MIWHCRLGHPSFPYLKKLFPSLFKNNDVFECEVCQLAKHMCSNFPAKPYTASQPFALIHSDITFIDDHTHVCWVYLLKEKSEAAKTFKDFHSMIQNQYNTNIQIFHTDNGKEYFNFILGEFFSQKRIIHQSTCTNTS